MIAALGFGEERAHSAIRISVGRFNSENEIEQAIDRISVAVQELQQMFALLNDQTEVQW